MKNFVSVALLMSGLLLGQQANTSAATFTVDAQDGPAYPTDVVVRTNTIATVGFLGFPNSPFLLAMSATGDTQVFSTTVFGDKLDIPYDPPVLPWLNGLFGPGIATFKLSVFGSYVFPVSISTAQAINSTAAFQAVITDPSSAFGYSLTGATRTTMALGPVVTDHALGNSGFAAINLTSWSFPFYATSYTALHLCANGYMTMGLAQADFSSSPGQLTSGLPRIAGFWCDLDQFGSAVIRTTVDSSPPGDSPFVLVEFIDVADWSGVGFNHTFSWRVNSLGEIKITGDYTNSMSMYETIVAIGPGSNLNPNIPMRDFTAVQDFAPFVAVGGVDENFYEWFGQTTMPAYTLVTNNPYDLVGRTLNFIPGGAGSTVVATTSSYVLY